MCLATAASVTPERLLALCGPKRPRVFVLIAFELVGHPEQRAKDDGAIVAGELDVDRP